MGAVIATLQTEPGGSLILILLILFLVALAWIIYLHISQSSDPEKIRKKFTKNSDFGWMEIDNIYFCPKCLAEDPPRMARLVEEFSDVDTRDVWMCPHKCRCAYFGPVYRARQKERNKKKLEEEQQANKT